MKFTDHILILHRVLLLVCPLVVVTVFLVWESLTKQLLLRGGRAVLLLILPILSSFIETWAAVPILIRAINLILFDERNEPLFMATKRHGGSSKYYSMKIA